MIEVASTNVGDISTRLQTHSHKQQSTSVSLMTRIHHTYDPESYVDGQGKKWEQAMHHEIDSFKKNNTWDLVP